MSNSIGSTSTIASVNNYYTAFNNHNNKTLNHNKKTLNPPCRRLKSHAIQVSDGSKANPMVSSSVDATLHRPYDAFINHRGPDTKKDIASFLYNRLEAEGLRSFLDQDELLVGNDITSQIERAIESASVHVAIFSPRYAESECCLNELTLMLESGAPIIPVFYNVQPSDLRRTDGKYGEALRNLENLETLDTKTNLKKLVHHPSTIQKWRDALKQVSKISGLHLQETCNGDKGKLLEMIVQHVLEKVKTARLENSCLVNLDTGNDTHMLGHHGHERIISKPQKSDMSQKDNDHILQQSNFQDHNSAISRDPFAWKKLCNCRQKPKSKCLETEYGCEGNFEEAPRCSTLENSRLRKKLNQMKKENARLRNKSNQMKKESSNEKIHQTEVFSFCKTEPVLVVVSLEKVNVFPVGIMMIIMVVVFKLSDRR